jgi:hypothetical protein
LATFTGGGATVMKGSTTMTTEKQRRILDEARSTLRGSKGIHSSDTLDRDALARWSALKKRNEEPPAVPTTPEPPALDWPMMQAWLDSHVAAAIERERTGLLQAVGEFVAEMIEQARRQSKGELADELRALRRDSKNELGDEVRALRIEFCETAAVVAELHTAMAELRCLQIAERTGGAVDVTNWPRPAKPAN